MGEKLNRMAAKDARYLVSFTVGLMMLAVIASVIGTYHCSEALSATVSRHQSGYPPPPPSTRERRSLAYIGIGQEKRRTQEIVRKPPKNFFRKARRQGPRQRSRLAAGRSGQGSKQGQKIVRKPMEGERYYSAYSPRPSPRHRRMTHGF